MGLLLLITGFFGLVASAVRLSVSTAFAVAALAVSGLSVVFSYNGLKVLTTGVLVWTIAAVWSASHSTIYGVVDDVWCEAEPLRIFMANLTDFLASKSEGIICFYNLIIHWMSIITFEFFAIALECPDPVILAAGEGFSLVGSALQQWINLLFAPLTYTVDLTQVWVHWVAAMDEVENYMQCFCYDMAPLIELIHDLVTPPSLQCTIEGAINAVITIVRIPVNMIFIDFPVLTIEYPDLGPSFDALCTLLECVGNFFDEELQILASTALGSPVANPSIGCTIGTFLCVALRAIELIADFFLLVIKLITSVLDLAQFIENGLDFDPLLDSLTDLSVCVYNLFANFNVCAGQAAQAIIILVVRSVELLLEVVRHPTAIDTAVANWKSALDDVIGDTQYGELGEEIFPGIFHSNDAVFGLHTFSWYCDMNANGVIDGFSVTIDSVLYTGSDLSYPCAPGYTDLSTCQLGNTTYRSHCILQNSRPQTALTCFVAGILGNGICSRAVADFLSSVVQLLLTGLDFVLQLYEGLPAPGDTGVCGPFGTSTDRENTIVFITSLFNLVISRVLSIFDYLGHLLECLPLFSPFGHIISVVVYAIFDVLNDLTRLLAIVVAFIIEGVIMIIELVSLTKLFDGCSQYQIVFWIDIFFENLLTELLRIISQFINTILFNGFPGIINFGEPDYSDGGHPGFTECIFHFGDCICVLVQSIIEEVFSLGPDCGTITWTTLRKRDVAGPPDVTFDMMGAREEYANHPVFEFVDRLTNNKFSTDTECGFILHEFNPYRVRNISDVHLMKYYDCMKLLVAGHNLAKQVPGVPQDFYFDKAKVHNTTLNVIRSIPYMFYYWITHSNQTTEEFMPHITDPVTHMVWKSAMTSMRAKAEKLRAPSPAAPSNPVYSHLEMGSEAVRLAFLIPVKLFNSLVKRNITGAVSDAVTQIDTLRKRVNIYQASYGTVYDPELVYANRTSNATATLRLSKMALGLRAYGDVFAQGGDYVLQVHAPVLTNITDIINLLITGHLNESYTNVQPLIPGFQCRGFDGILRRLFNKTKRCVEAFNITSLGEWGGLTLEPESNTTMRPLRSQVFMPEVVTVGGKTDVLTTVIFDIAQFLNDRVLGNLLGNIKQWPTQLVNAFTNTNVDDSSGGAHGVWWYIAFPFYCSTEKLDCSNGRGVVDGINWTLLYTVIIAMVIGFVLPSGVGSLAVVLLTMSVPALFLAISFGYPMVCFPRVPECSAREVANFFQSINVTCVPWPDGVVAGDCISGCPVSRSIVDCRTSAGILDGVDELVQLLEWFFPTEMEMIRSNWIFGYVKRIPWLGTTLEQNNPNGVTPNAMQKFCIDNQLPLLVQPLIFFTAGAAAVAISVLAIEAAFSALIAFGQSFGTFITSAYLSWKLAYLSDRIQD